MILNLCRLCKKRVFYADSVSFSSQCGIKTVNVMIEKSAEKSEETQRGNGENDL